MGRINYLTKTDILKAHSIGFGQYGGTLKGYDNSCVENRVIDPKSEYFGVEIYQGVLMKASVYWHRITTSHCFNDGNKRTGVISMLLFLELNGYEVVADDDSLFDYCLLIANHKTRPSIEEVEKWLIKNTIKLK